MIRLLLLLLTVFSLNQTVAQGIDAPAPASNHFNEQLAKELNQVLLKEDQNEDIDEQKALLIAEVGHKKRKTFQMVENFEVIRYVVSHVVVTSAVKCLG